MQRIMTKAAEPTAIPAIGPGPRELEEDEAPSGLGADDEGEIVVVPVPVLPPVSPSAGMD